VNIKGDAMEIIEIENNEPPPQVKKTRARKTAEKQQPKAAKLIEALKFISVAQKKVGEVQQQFCYLGNNWAVASNGILTIATPIQEDLHCCPHTYQFLDALTKCKDELQIAQLSPELLCVNSDKFRAHIACVDASVISLPAPDSNIAPVDDRLKAAFACLAPLIVDESPNPIAASLLLQANTAVATDLGALIEYWHGIDLPPGLLLPRAAALAVSRTSKKLTGFGYSPSSVTFYFEDGSLIKSQLYNANFPNYLPIFESQGQLKNLPVSFYIAVHAIESFSVNGIVHFEDGLMSSNELESEGTTYKVKGLPIGMAFMAKKLILLEKFIKTAYFDEEAKRMFFQGENLRGVLMGCEVSKPIRDSNFDDSDIPF
jgi:hypothetical protein